MPSPSAALKKALEHHQGGGLRKAQRLYRRILADDPRNADALHMLGVAALQSGRHDEAEQHIRKAIQIAADRAVFHNDLGEVLTVRRRLDEAQPCFEEALRLCPDYAEAHNNLGLCHHARGRVAPALRCFYWAMRLRPDFAEPFNHAGIIAFKEHQPDQAMLFFQTAFRLDPNYAEAIGNLGLVYLSGEKHAEAADCFHEAIRLKPSYAAAHNNLGILHQYHARFDEALACFQRALQLDPQSAEAHNNMGNAMRSMKRLPEALKWYQKALQLNPYHHEAQTNLGMMLSEQGRHAEAVAGFEQALAHAPNDGLKLLSLLTLPVIYESVESVARHRRRFEDNLARLAGEPLVIDDPVRQVGNLVFYLAYQGLNDRAVMTGMADLLARATPSLRYTAPHCAGIESVDGRPIRLGFISHHFHNHTIARLNGGIIRELAKNPRFHVAAFTCVPRDDEWGRFIRDGAHCRIALPCHLPEARRRIADERLDVLFYTDIGMDPLTYFLAFARLAPVQCVTWGHPITTGIPTIDYYLSARDLDPEDGDEHYSERLVRLENLNTYFLKMPAVPRRSRRSYGLDDDERLYVCPQSLFKFHPDFDAYLKGILAADPRGKIVLVAGHHDYWMTTLRERFRVAFGSDAERVVVLPRQSAADFLSLLASADVSLDPLPFGGGVSSMESFAVGCPVVTLPGQFLRGRITSTCYRRMGVLDCLAADRDDYVRIAVRLANDKQWRDDVSARILTAKDVLFENRGVIAEFEQFFLNAVAQATRK